MLLRRLLPKRATTSSIITRLARPSIITSHFIHSVPNEAKLNYENLFQFIKRNKTLPQLIASVKADDHKLVECKKAVTDGNPKAQIFSDPECYIYLLRLLKDEKIPFWQGMTAYHYLTMLMQFTNKQPLKEKDADVKVSRFMDVNFLARNNQITLEGNQYLQSVYKRFAMLDIDLDPKQLSNFVLTLSPIDQWVFQYNYRFPALKTHYDYMMAAVCHNLPFTPRAKTYDAICHPTSEHVWVPSFAMMRFFHKQISPQPLEMQPVFGEIGLKSLLKLHAQGIHPVSLYAYHVLSNTPKTHNKRVGPTAAMIHDAGHATWGTLLTPADRRIIYTCLIPEIKKMTSVAREHVDRYLVARLSYIITNLDDFNLTPNKEFRDPQSRFMHYLGKAFSQTEDESDPEYALANPMISAIGDRVEERLYFLILRHMLSGTSKNQKIWEKIITDVFNLYIKTPDRIKDALLKLAAPGNTKLSSVPATKDSEVNWVEWLKLVESTSDSLALWQKVTEKYPEELLILINRYGLKFFHPNLPMTEEKRNDFRTFLTNMCNVNPREEEQNWHLPRPR